MASRSSSSSPVTMGSTSSSSSSRSSPASFWSSSAMAWVMSVALVAAATGEGLRVNKCCGAKEQLDRLLRRCVPYDPMPNATLDEESTAVPSGGGAPWWVLNDTALLEPSTLQPLADAAAAWAGAAWELARRPCNYSDMQYLVASKRDTYRLLANGSLLLPAWRTDASGRGQEPVEVELPPDEWCADQVASAGARPGPHLLLACPCGRITCVNRCCNKDSMFRGARNRQVFNFVCQKVANGSAQAQVPAFYNGLRPLNESDTEGGGDAGGGEEGRGGEGGEGGEGVVYTQLVAHSLECDKVTYGKYLLNSNALDTKRSFWLQRNGSARIEEHNHGRVFPRENVCLVEVLQPDGAVQEDVFFCHRRTTDEAPSQENVYYSLLFLVGALFLLLTLVVHALVPELRRSAHAKALMCHCATLLVASIGVIVGHLRRRADQPSCSINAFVVQFFFLSTFFWLNVMCFDVSWTFGAMRRRMPSGTSQNRRFLWYSLYAWGCPVIITGITLFMEYSSLVPPDLPLLPNFGARSCWFDTKMATFVYFYGPIALLLLVNLVLFVFTVARIRHSRRGTSILRKGSANARVAGGAGAGDGGGRDAEPRGASDQAASEVSTLSASVAASALATTDKSKKSAPPASRAAKAGDRQMLIVFTKLFCLMGVTWALEIIMWLVGEEAVFWYIADTINMLRGVLIFIFFCWKPSVLRPLRAHLRACARRCCPWALRALSLDRTKTATSISTMESSLSVPEMTDVAATTIVPAAPSVMSAIQDNAL